MTQSSTFADALNSSGIHLARVQTREVVRGCGTLAVGLVILFAGWAVANGQVPTGIGPIQQNPCGAFLENCSAATPGPTIAGGTASSVPGSLSNSGNGSASASLSYEQIVDLLQQNPDIVVELKSQLADSMQRQGEEIDANDITDEMLYEQIGSSAALRASMTTFLRARGYVSEGAIGAPTPGATDQRAYSGSELPQMPPSPQREIEARRSSSTADVLSGRMSYKDDSPVSSTEQLEAGRRRSTGEPRSHEEVNASTDEPKVLRQPAPYNLRAMRELYTQVPEQIGPLKRFGSDVFTDHDASSITNAEAERNPPPDVPLGPDYVVGSGDTLTINLWGGLVESFTRVIDRDGRILLPEAGSIELSGLRLDRAQGLIEAALKQQFRSAHVAVTVSHLRSVRIYVVGDVQRPGGYDVSSLATPLSSLYAAGGPTSVGSLRILRHFRGKQLVDDMDLYDFLLHGMHSWSAHLESGDTLLVPPAGPQVAVYGAVKRPAIYELKSSQESLPAVIDDAGGFTAAASTSNISIERIGENHKRETLTPYKTEEGSPQASKTALASFQVQDGDRIHVAPILPFSDRTIYLAGHFVRPGRQSYTDDMRLSDVLRSYQDMLPEPAAHGEIVRLVPPDLHAETIVFDVPDVLIGNANIGLRPFDTIRVFGRYEVDAPKVTIHGEVLRPGTYPLSRGMTVAQLVRMAGGFRRDAMLDSADLTSYSVADGHRVVGSLATVRIGAAVAATEPDADIRLKPGDILTIHQITGWNEIGESITIDGQVAFPGSYGFQEGERLSSVLRRAGGFRDTAYPEGALLIRDQVRELEEKSRDELIRQIETNSAAARLSPDLSPGDTTSTLQLIKAQQDDVLAQLKSHPPSGRLVVHLNADIDSWANTAADIELRRGDRLTIPKRPGFVLVTGQVYNATALTFSPGQTAAWYLGHAGGTNTTADRKQIFVIRVNGSVIGRHSGGDVLSTKLDPGDVVVVPQKVIGSSLFWRNLLTAAQLASSVAITAAVASL
jgi:protein involved in polysaccharide export with SLBB domain